MSNEKFKMSGQGLYILFPWFMLILTVCADSYVFSADETTEYASTQEKSRQYRGLPFPSTAESSIVTRHPEHFTSSQHATYN
jgi:hypothetical protein